MNREEPAIATSVLDSKATFKVYPALPEVCGHEDSIYYSLSASIYAIIKSLTCLFLAVFKP